MASTTEHHATHWKTLWPPSIHTQLEQITRICSAQKISSSKLTIHESDAAGWIVGSAPTPYHVTLDSCECGDFKRRRLPCKHIYRLAIALGILADVPVYNKKAARAYDFKAEIERFHQLYIQGIITGEQYVKIATVLQK